MYRIEVAPGEETVFRSIEELAVGIRNGVVTQRSRIYHHASQKWLPIGLHPHYKKALEMPALSAAHPPTPTPASATPWSRPRVESPVEAHRHEPTPAPATKVPAPTMSPVVAMQREVLRDLPVISIPEPPRRSPPPSPPEPAEAPYRPAAGASIVPAVLSQPTATFIYAPRVPEAAAPAHPLAPAPFPVPAEPVEEVPARPTARRSRRARRRPQLLIGVAGALVLGAHFALTATPSASADFDIAEPEAIATESPESNAPAPSRGKPAAQVTSPAGATVAAATTPVAATMPRVTSSPARVRMTPGPAFAGSAPVQPGADTVAPRTKAPVAASPSAADTTSPGHTIAPAPAEMELTLPDLPSNSLAPSRRSDTMAMKKILRALNGSKP